MGKAAALTLGLAAALLLSGCGSDPVFAGEFKSLGAKDFTATVTPAGPAEWRTADRAYSDESGIYLVRYNYNLAMVFLPAVMGKSEAHFQADITVFRMKVQGDDEQIGPTFDGTYTVNGCFEDDPESLVAKAKVLAAQAQDGAK